MGGWDKRWGAMEDTHFPLAAYLHEKYVIILTFTFPPRPRKTLINNLIQPKATVTCCGSAAVGSRLFLSAATSAETGSSLSEPGFILF